MPPETSSPSDLIYGLNDRPKPIPAILAAAQHVLAAFVGIITPPLIIGSTLGLTAHLPYLISMALMVSGVGTFIQARRPFGIGAGMICLQGTSFAFLGAVLSAGFLVKQRGGSPEDIMAMIFGVCFFGAAVQIVLSRFIGQLRRVITPLVTGIVITLIGISLIKVGITDLGGGFNAPDFGAPVNLALGVFVVLTIILLNRSNTPWVRLSAIIIGLALGSLAAWFSGKLVPQALPDLPLISVPMPFRFGFNFDWSAFLPIALIYLISSIETVGDLTANCMIARQPISGPSYISRLKGGVLGDGVSCMIAATFSAFPNTTFAQNNGVIQLTGVASRYVGLHRRAAVLSRLVSVDWCRAAANSQAGIGRRHPGDVRQRGRCRGAHPCAGATGPAQHADHRHLVRRRPGHCRPTGPVALDAVPGAKPVRLSHHQRRPDRHRVVPVVTGNQNDLRCRKPRAGKRHAGTALTVLLHRDLSEA